MPIDTSMGTWWDQSTPWEMPGQTGATKPDVVKKIDYNAWADKMNALQQAHNAGRIPDAKALETSSSARIAELLNPPSMFTDTNRMAAEAGAGMGVPGSAATWSGVTRMTDEERLKRIALGETLLTGALGRNPTAPLPDPSTFVISPQQAEQNLLGAQANAANNATARYVADQRYGQTAGTTPAPYQSDMNGPFNLFGGYNGLPMDTAGTRSPLAGYLGVQPEEDFDAIFNGIASSDPLANVLGGAGGPFDFLVAGNAGGGDTPDFGL